jgi:hypothetical protein
MAVPGVHPGPVHVTFLAETMAMAQVSLPVLHFSPSVAIRQCCTLTLLLIPLLSKEETGKG